MLFSYSKRNHKKYHVEDLGIDMFFIWLGWSNKFLFLLNKLWINLFSFDEWKIHYQIKAEKYLSIKITVF